MQLFCRTYSQQCSRPSCTGPIRPTESGRSPGDVFNDHLNFSNVFDSIINEKRPRSSSITIQNSPPDKILRVDVPVPHVSAANTTVSSISDPGLQPIAIPGANFSDLATALIASQRAAVVELAAVQQNALHHTSADQVDRVAAQQTAQQTAIDRAAAEQAAQQAAVVRDAAHQIF